MIFLKMHSIAEIEIYIVEFPSFYIRNIGHFLKWADTSLEAFSFPTRLEV